MSQRRSGSTTYDLPAPLGSAWRQSTATSSGSVSNRNYDAFGLTLSTMGSPVGPFGYAATSGYQEDMDSGLKLLGHRYYDASTGRFLSRDPVKDGRNWYGYCDGNPLKSVDPTGEIIPFLIYAAVFAVVAIISIGSAEAPTHPGETHDPKEAGIDKLHAMTPFLMPIMAEGTTAGLSEGSGGTLESDPTEPPGDYYRRQMPGTPRGSGMEPTQTEYPPETIGGREYTSHAVSRMIQRRIPISVIEDTIENGIPGPVRENGGQPIQGPHVKVVIDPGTGRVISIM